MDVLSLLQSKKKCLRKFLEVSARFLAVAENGDISTLDTFEHQREAALKALEMYDRKLTQVVQAMPLELRTSTLAKAVQKSLDDEAVIVQTILRTDTQIILCLEIEKTRITREITLNDKTKAITGRFKSSWIPESGEGLDTKV